MSQPYHYFSHLKITIDNRIINIIGFLKKKIKKTGKFLQCNMPSVDRRRRRRITGYNLCIHLIYVIFGSEKNDRFTIYPCSVRK